MRDGTTFEKIVYWLFADRIPVTKLLIIAQALSIVLINVFHLEATYRYTVFASQGLRAMPWTVLSYPIPALCGSAMCLVMTMLGWYWLWLAGGSLERAWGSRTFTLFFFGVSALTAAGLFIAGSITGTNVIAYGLWLPIAGITVAFAMLNPDQEILFSFVLPLKLKYLALLDVIIVLVSVSGNYNVVVGLFALLGCAFSYLYVTKGSRLYFGERPDRHKEKIIRLHSRRSYNPMRWYGGYKERKRFKDFLNKSGFGE